MYLLLLLIGSPESPVVIPSLVSGSYKALRKSGALFAVITVPPGKNGICASPPEKGFVKLSIIITDAYTL